MSQQQGMGAGRGAPFEPLVGTLLHCLSKTRKRGGVQGDPEANTPLLLWTEWLTHACENITLPQT